MLAMMFDLNSRNKFQKLTGQVGCFAFCFNSMSHPKTNCHNLRFGTEFPNRRTDILFLN